MYERFTDRARKVMQLANREAQRFQHSYIGTEHILLGLARQGSGVAFHALKNLGVEPWTILREIENVIQSGSHTGDIAKSTPTPRAKKVIEYAMEEARHLKHSYVGTEHILLGLLREEEGLASVVLMDLGLRLEKVRAEIQAILRCHEDEGIAAHSAQSRIQGGEQKKESHVYQLDDDTKRRVRQLAEAIAPLQKEKMDAVGCQEFSQAAQLRDKQDQYWKELGNMNVPEWVLKNVKRFVRAWENMTSRFPLLDMLHGEAGEADAGVLSVLPNPLLAPVKIVVGTVPRFPVSTLQAALAPEDICSPYFMALVPLISPESVAPFKENLTKLLEGNLEKMMRFAFFEIEKSEDTLWGRPVLLCLVRPTLLSQEVKSELFAGLHQTNCDFVVFEAGEEAHSLLGNLPPGTKLLKF